MHKAILTDIQRFSVHDGPGIRTTLFFKGCNLNCEWCHNPETINKNISIGYKKNKCQLCYQCVDNKVIKKNNNKLSIDFININNLDEVINSCPYGCYFQVGHDYSIDELMEVILKDNDLYKKSQGGVTLSGGEAILQAEFLIEFCKILKMHKINIYLDLSGKFYKSIAKVLPHIDGVLLDYKIKPSKKIIDELGNLYDFDKTISVLEHTKIILRCPIIPGFNLNNEHFSEISILRKNFPNIDEIHFLPYHYLKKDFVASEKIILNKNINNEKLKKDILNYTQLYDFGNFTIY